MRVDNIIDPRKWVKTFEVLDAPFAPRDVIQFFNFLQDNIELEYDGMGGVSLRESKASLKKLMKIEEYDYGLYKTFVKKFENAMISSHMERRSEDKKD